MNGAPITVYKKIGVVCKAIAVACILTVAFWVHFIVGICFLGLIAFEFMEIARELDKKEVERLQPKGPENGGDH
jgi:uncharacterized membrane protein YesL